MPRSDAAPASVAPRSREGLAALHEPRVALVTGAAGFGGSYLTRALEASAWSIVGLGRRKPPAGEAGGRCRFLEVDLRDGSTVRDVVRDVAPDYVFHLAAATPPQPDRECFAVNVAATTSLLEAVAQAAPRAAVLVVGSDAQYGPLEPAHVPTSEAAPMHPVGAYGRSKVLQEAIALRYASMAGLRVVCVRPFNYIGPGQSDHFVVSRIAHQIAVAEQSPGEGAVELGSVRAVRDFTDVRDMVDAFIRALLLGSSGAVYNVGSGTGHRIGLVAGKLAAMATKPMAVRSVPGRVRPTDVQVTTCDASLLRRDTGWVPCVPLDQTLADTLSSWRALTNSDVHNPDVFRPRRSAS